MSGGQQVLRTRLAELLRVAERVGDAFPELGGGYELPNAAFSDVTIDVLARTVTKRGADVALTPLEFDLLVALFDRKGAAVSRRELLRDVWKGKNGVTTRTVDTHIFNLRQKLENDPSRPAHFVTVSKIGYRLKF
jgi:DNA-binding response OmpR family regulator